MSSNLKNRSFLKLEDFSAAEIASLLALAAELKLAKRQGREQKSLTGKNIALIFEKNSTRTRIGFEVAAYDQGAHVTYLGPTDLHIGYQETIADSARVLERIYDGIEYRGFGQEIAETLAAYSSVPVYNGLTDEFHPTQIIADLLTMREHSVKPLPEVAFCFIGDAGKNMGDSLLVGGAIMGMDVRLCAPQVCWPQQDIVDRCRVLAGQSGGSITLTEDTYAAVDGCDFVYTDVWLSMSESDAAWLERIELLYPYQVNAALMQATHNPNAKFMHCLPAFHDSKTAVGKKIKELYDLESMEVTDEVFESNASIVFDQAENRMHTIKAVLVATLGD